MTELDPRIAEARLEHSLRRALPTLAVAASVIFCHKTGLDYVSCSPYRVPVARLAAAHAALGV